MCLSDNLTAKKKQLHNEEQKIVILQESLYEKSKTAIELEKQLVKILKSSTEKEERMKELVERLQLKETEVQLMCTHLYLNVLYKPLAKHFSNNEHLILYDLCGS